MEEIELDSVSKRFADVAAVESISLEVNKGELLTILGPSGCGKSTTLSLIAGFLKPDSGSIYIGGALVNDIPPYKRNVSMVFQNYALFPHMTVEQNIEFGLKMRKVEKRETSARIADALKLVRMQNMEKRFPHQLSGGQQQRIAIARAIVVNPNVLLLDEPLSNLDSKLRQSMREEIRAIQKDLATTAIYVTHDQLEALSMSDRVAVMNKGRVVRLGKPSEIYESPGSRFVADFIGEANFLDGKVLRVSASDILVGTKIGDFYVATTNIPREAGVHLAEGSAVTVCLRPERLRTASLPATTAEREAVISATVQDVIYMGSILKYKVGLEDGTVMNIEERNRPAAGFRVGERIAIKAGPEDCSLILET